MSIYVHETTRTFHLQNEYLSYIMTVLPNGHIGQLYFGARIRDRESFSYLLEGCRRSQSACVEEDPDSCWSLEHLRQEYPVYGSSDFREGAVEILHENGSRICDFRYIGYRLRKGKPSLEGLPALYTEQNEEADTLILELRDPLSGALLELSYTLFAMSGALARSARIVNAGEQVLFVDKAMSLSLDLPDADYDWIQFSGSWSREREPGKHRLHQGIQAVESLRGHSSHQQNPFVILKRPETTEQDGSAIGLAFIYSGNFLAQAQVDTYHVTRLMIGIHPAWFSWKLSPGESFQTPEAVLFYTDSGLNDLSRTIHRLFRTRLARGAWRDRVRPILLNNWEATYFDFDEPKLLEIAEKAKECGAEMFVLDDGWFGARRSDYAGLGDWVPARELLPDGIKGLSEKIEAMGLLFGLWIEPEMVNPDSDLYRAHPDWILSVPGRRVSPSRHQYVLDFSRADVVDYIHGMIASLLRTSKISYIKWDMNRSITECGSAALPPDRQGEVFHRYILGVYDLYERLISEFPGVLFESCAGGGGRFDPGMLYYAPQAWTSDDTDAVERVKIQYGTSYAYPVSSMGSHVSAVPNHQVGRITPLKTRAETAFFGTYGYELDPTKLTEEETEELREYSAFMKDHRELIQFGDFYRLLSPFEGDEAAWMTVSPDRKKALVGRYRTLNRPNDGFRRLKLTGLDPDLVYRVKGRGSFGGDELMRAGLVTSGISSGCGGLHERPEGDYLSWLYELEAVEEEA